MLYEGSIADHYYNPEEQVIDVIIDGDEIRLDYRTRDSRQIWTCTRREGGHFDMKSPLGGYGTLHIDPKRPDILEGYFFEERVGGMWRIQLAEQPT